ncbi:MAG TPA: SigE family RNA polymerase sigma factor [Micromonosporaceae bacterium]|nr:SigE family RNA polymerase sigma factor [Micromonosporaceae bacterium]
MAEDDAFVEFVRSRSAALYRYAYLLAGNPHDADDLVQEALIRLRSAWPRVRRQDDPIGYTRATIARLHVSTWRRLRRESVVADVPETAVDESGFHDAARRTALSKALAALPPRQRAVIVLRFYEEQTEEEIAAILGISRGTVRSQAARAFAKLRATPQLELLRGGTT